jgi:hypothetical protein
MARDLSAAGFAVEHERASGTPASLACRLSSRSIGPGTGSETI